MFGHVFICLRLTISQTKQVGGTVRKEKFTKQSFLGSQLLKRFLFVFVLLWPSYTFGNGVNRLVPSQYPTIQDAINDCNDGDVVIIAPNTYTGPGNRDIDFNGLGITVRSTDPNDPDVVSATIIDCNGTQAEPHRGFYFQNYEDANSVLAGLTITNGYERHGGGIFCFYSHPTITKCIIANNTAYDANSHGGGGIFCFYSDAMISDCIITGNTAIGDTNSGANGGGGVRGWGWDSTGTISNCIISHNSAGYRGGGLYSFYGKITDCIITENSATYGAGIHNCQGPITNCIISNNSAQLAGGMDVCGGPITNCIITGNSANGVAGGLGWCFGTITNCIISGNAAGKNTPGGMYCNGGGLYSCRATVSNCVITGNIAGNKGGGIGNYFDETIIINSIVWNNEALQGSQIAVWGNATNCSVYYSNVQGGEEGVAVDETCTLNWGKGNIVDDPCFVDMGYWDSNGTPSDSNDDFWVDSGDYHLKSQAGRWDVGPQGWVTDEVTSPCIDAGDMSSPIGYEPFPNGGCINMGAYGGTAQASKSYFGQPVCQTPVAGDINGDCKVDFYDLAFLAYHWMQDNNP